MKANPLHKNQAYIAFILVSSLMYLLWGILTPRFFIPEGAQDGIITRLPGLVIPTFGLILYWIKGERADLRRLVELTFFGYLFNYSYILHVNHYEQVYVIGSFIIQTGANSIIDREKPLVLYNISNMALAFLIFFDPARGVNSLFYLTSIGTIALVMGTMNILKLTAQKKYLELEERLSIEENKRIIFEGLAHEINNPLMILQSFKEKILRVSARSEPAELEILVEMIIKEKKDSLSSAIMRIHDLISDLNKTAGGNLTIKKEEINVSLILKVIIQQLAKKDNVTVELIENNELTLFYDRTSFIKIVKEVLKNAIDFAEKQVTISIHPTYISITNDGPRIPKHIEAKIFEPFFTTKDIGGGKGLGLSIAKGLSTQHSSKLILAQNSERLVSFQLKFS